MARSLKVSSSNIPLEVFEHILERQELTFTDVCNFSLTCHKFSDLVYRYGNKIWKAKYKQMWPELASSDYFKKFDEIDWLSEFRQRLLIGHQTMRIVSAMSDQHIKQEMLSHTDFKPFEQLIVDSEHKLTLKFMINECMQLIHQTDRNKNLTKKYYCVKVLRHLRQLDLGNQWDEFINTPPDKQLVERGAVIIAQWDQPTIEVSHQPIVSQLDSIAEEVLKVIHQEHGENHVALSVPVEVRECWRTHNLQDNYFSPHVCRQVLAVVSSVLFEQMGFQGDSTLYYSHENFCINKVLENRKGIPIILSILFESVSRRLGVKCESVTFPGHSLLRWRDTYKHSVPVQYFYIDVLNKGRFMGKESCPQFANSHGRCPMGDILQYAPATPCQVMEKMALNLEVAERQQSGNDRIARLRSALELSNMINKSDVNCIIQVARFYMQNNLNVSDLRQALELREYADFRARTQALLLSTTLMDYERNIYNPRPKGSSKALKVKRREGCDVKYSVGLMMHHVLYNYTCVIIGWDTMCNANEEWIAQMNVENLSRQHLQPFYNVLVSDGTCRYAAEDNLLLARVASAGVDHWEVGRYFQEFCGNHYLMNEEMLRAYPDDLAATRALLNLE